MHISSSLVIGAIALAASAQTAQQNASAAAIAAMIPACARPCDDSAITQVGCGLTDYACHCAHGTQLAALIPTCLTSNSNCTAADLQTFGALPAKICAALNSTSSTNSTTTSKGSGSATATPSAPTSPGSTATATSVNMAGLNGVASAMFAVVGAGVLGIII